MNLIREIRLPNGRLTKNLGFGCAGILRLPVSWQRENLLRTALDAGITHFDVARMYGVGAAERILGTSLKSQRSKITLATKFGFPCLVPSLRTVFFQSAGRWAVNLHPRIKKYLKQRTASKGDRHFDYSREEMEGSLNTSLRQLQTDHVDLFFVHEPRATDVIPDSLGEALQIAKAGGKTGAYGVSGSPSDVLYFLKHRPEICGEAIQHHFSLDEAQNSGIPLLVYRGVFHVLVGSLPAVQVILERENAFAKSWSDKLSMDLAKRENLAATILAMALNDNPLRMTLFFTTSANRLRRVVKLLADNSFSQKSLSEFRNQLVEKLKETHAL